MKAMLFFLTITVCLMTSCYGNNPYSENEMLEIRQSLESCLMTMPQNDTLLKHIQKKVLDAFVQAKISQTDKPIADLEKDLMVRMKNNNSIVTYWYSYVCYYHSIYFMTTKDDKGSSGILDEGIKQLENVTNKNSEHLALLALMESLSMQYAPGMEVPFISKRIKQNADKALQLDPINLRAYYVLGSNDFYTPEQYGGGKKAEGYLLKAIKLKDQSVTNPYLPSWGRSNAYEMLIRHYIKHEQFAEAKKVYQEAVAYFPDDYMINNLAKQLINH